MFGGVLQAASPQGVGAVAATSAEASPSSSDVIEDLSDATLAKVHARYAHATTSTAIAAPVSISRPVATPMTTEATTVAQPTDPLSAAHPTVEPIGDVSQARPVAASAIPPNPAVPASSFVEAPSVIVGPKPTKFPLSTHDKFMLWANDMKDPMNIVAAAWNAGIDQASDAHSEFGEGAEGYGKRIGAGMADTATGSFVQGFMFPTIFHQDPRYFTSGKRGTGARFGYAVSRVMVGRSDSGHWTFNFAEVLGVVTTSAVENVYYPDHRTLGDTAVRAGTGIAVDAGWNVLKEFWPDLSRKFRLPIWFQRMFWSSQYTYVYNRPVAPPVDPAPQSPAPTTAPK